MSCMGEFSSVLRYSKRDNSWKRFVMISFGGCSLQFCNLFIIFFLSCSVFWFKSHFQMFPFMVEMHYFWVCWLKAWTQVAGLFIVETCCFNDRAQICQTHLHPPLLGPHWSKKRGQSHWEAEREENCGDLVFTNKGLKSFQKALQKLEEWHLNTSSSLNFWYQKADELCDSLDSCSDLIGAAYVSNLNRSGIVTVNVVCLLPQ